MLEKELEKRELPELLKLNNDTAIKSLMDWEKRKNEIRELLSMEEYGYFPEKHVPISIEVLEEDDKYCRRTAIFRKILLTLHLKDGKFSFPVKMSIPYKNKVSPAFLYISFYDEFPNKYLPVEEICDQGFAVVSFCYKDVTSDDNDFSNGLSKFFYKENEKRNFGKILLWSWAASHVMDYMQGIPQIDKEKIAIVGHSRLGKTALLTGAYDERFKYVISNNSGQSGAAISRKKGGESIKNICDRFPFWFCENYKKYSDSEDTMPFDQHYLLSLIAPRNLYIASSSEDSWADPHSEFLCALAVNPIYELYGKKGLIHFDKYLEAGEKLLDGNIGYHVRDGWHYLSRHDWNTFIEYIKKHENF